MMTGIVNTKTRALARLVSARVKGKWLSRRELLQMGISKRYIDSLLSRLLDQGLIERKGIPKHYRYQATEAGQARLELGPLPRAPLRKGERPRGQLVQLRPVTQLLDTDAMWMEHERVSVQLDQYSAERLREHCLPASRRDRAQQRSFSTSAFTVTISKRGACVLILKGPDWQEVLAKWILACGLSQPGTNSVMSLIRAQLPERFTRMEMPVLDRTIKDRDVQFVVSTRVGDDKVVSNINYSTNIDWEVYGSGFLVDQWLAVLAGTQHNQVVVLRAMEQKVMELSRQVEELRKEKEAKKVPKKEGDYYV